MNEYQIARQLQYLLETRLWGGSGSTVFGHVIITSDPIEDSVHGNIMPVLVIQPGSCDNDPEFPEIVTQRFRLIIATPGRNDHHGQSGLVGGVRTSFTASGGRGVMELTAEALATIQRSDSETGIIVRSAARGIAATRTFDGNTFGVQEIEIEARGGSQPYYHPARKFVASGNSLTWTNPPDRFDRYQMILRYASGSTAPTSVSTGTGATLSGVLASSYTHVAGAGTFSYALFAQYDQRRDGSTAGTSATDTSASVTLTGTFT